MCYFRADVAFALAALPHKQQGLRVRLSCIGRNTTNMQHNPVPCRLYDARSCSEKQKSRAPRHY